MSLARMLLVVLLGLCAAPAFAVIRTQVEPRLIEEMDTVQLVLRVEGQSQTEPPDLSPLDQDFDVLGSQTSSRISTINGRTTAMVEYQINLRPRRTGEITIPPIRIGAESSEPVTLSVRPLDPGVRETIERMVFFETELGANPVYVQAETVLTRRLYYSNGVQIYSDLPGAPAVADAVVIPLGEAQSFSTLRDGARYGVIEQRFALFPERSGTLTIEPISVTSSVRLTTGGRIRRSGIRVSTERLALEVLPIPAEYPKDAPWLPARSVTIDARFSPDSAAVDVGVQLELDVVVTVTGNAGSAIPPLAPDIPSAHFKIYPEAPDLEEITSGESVAGHRRQRYALIATAPGPVHIAPVSVVWWDTENARLRTATAGAHALEIVGESPTVPIQATSEHALEPGSDAPEIPPPPTPLPWTTLAVSALALLGLATAVVVLLRSPTLRGRLRRARALGAHDVRPRGALRRLERAARAGDAAGVRDSVTAFAVSLYGCDAPRALARFRRIPHAAAALDALNRSRYARGEQTAAFDARSLVDAARAAVRLERAARSRRRRRLEADALPPLSA